MGKIKLNAKLVSNDDNIDINCIGIKNKNKILYKENNINVTILMFNNKIKMNRKCNEYNINLIFEKNKTTNSTYQVFSSVKEFLLETKCKKLIINDKNIVIEYELEGNNFSYNLEMEDL